MSLILERNETGRNVVQTGCREGLERLRVGDAVVVLTRDDEHRGVPLVDELVGRVGIRALCRSVVFLPISATVVVVYEPQLLGVAIHRLEVEDAAVGNKGLETLLVATGQEIDRITTIRSTHTAHALLIGPRLFGYIVDGREVVADVLTRVIARDLIEPLLTKRGQTAAVGGYDYITLGGHELEIPAIAPRLRYDALRTTLAVEQRRVLLRRVKVGRQDHPYEHLLAIGRLNPAFLYLTHRDLVVDRLVDGRDMLHSTRCRVDSEELGRHRDAGHLGGNLLTGHREGVDVVITLREDLYLAIVPCYAADLVRSLDRGDEVELLVTVPHHVRGVVVEIGRQVAHLLRVQLIDKQTLLVRLVAGTTHRTEGNRAVIGRPYGIFVIAGHHIACLLRGFADVFGLLRGYVVEVDVRIGRDGIGGAGERLTRVGQYRAGVVPADLGHIEVGGQRSIPRCLCTDDVAPFGQLAIRQVGYEDVAMVALLPIVPVAYHQVIVDAGLRFVHVFVHVGRTAIGYVYRAYVPSTLTRGGDAEALDVEIEVGELPHVAAIGRHLPQLHLARTVGEEVDRGSIGTPLRSGVLRRAIGQGLHLACRQILDAKGRRAAILAHRVVRHGIEQSSAVGRERRLTGTAHLPHHLGGQSPLGNLLGCQGVVDCQWSRPLIARRSSHSCKSHHEQDFFHCCCGFLIYL